ADVSTPSAIAFLSCLDLYLPLRDLPSFPTRRSSDLLRLYDAAEARLDEIVTRLRQRHDLAPLALKDGVPPVTTASRYPRAAFERSEEHTSELQSHLNLVCRLLLETKKK